MEPLGALGLACNIVQLIQFVSTILSTTEEIYQSAEGSSTENLTLNNVAQNLRDLSSVLPRAGRPNAAGDKRSDAEKQLQMLCDEIDIVTNQILKYLDSLKSEQPHDRWASFRHALGCVVSQKEIRALEKRLAGVRVQFDTTLLICIRESLQTSQENSLSRADLDKIYMTNFGEVKNQFEEIMSAIRQMDQKTDYLDYVQRFPKDLDASADLRKEARFCDLILSRLEYTEMPNRYETIHDAHKQTFEWVFRDAAGATRPWDNFTRWLEDPEPEKGNIYWITGKPGSGKSTLMKFIYNDPRTVQHLTVWAGESTLATAGFFFWCSGTAMEMSRLGLLRSLLHQILHEHPNLITKVFHRRWQQYSFFRNGLQEWTWAELKNAFELLISESSLRLAFFIDGLDEFDGDHNELVKLILGAACLPHIKVCCASRPWLVFQDAFEHRPSLLLEHLTFEDIKRYISDEFSASKQYASLKEREPDAASLIDSVAERASGVFLWVMLVVNSLLQGIQNSDKVSDLRRRLESFPRDLESLYDRLLNSLDPFYFRQACQLIRIARAFDECSLADISLIQFSFADEENPAMAAIEAEIEPLPHAVWRAREEDMRRRLNSRCKGFLEADEYGRVRWLHRTAKDFIDTPHIWTKITQATEETFDPNLCLASAFLYELKCTGREHAELSMINRFLGLTALLERCTNEPQIPLVNEMHNFVRQPPAATSSGEPHDPRERPDKGFFADAVGAGNHLYILHLLENDPSRLGKPDLDEILEQIFTRQRYRDCSHLDLITKKAVERGAVPGPWIDHVSIPAEVRKAINPHLSLRARGKMSWQRIRRDISAALR